jgi:hypothetical protein
LHGIDESWAKDRAAHYRMRLTHTLRQYANHARSAEQTLLLETLISRAAEYGVQLC